LSQIFLDFFNRAMSAGWLILAVVLLRLVLKRAPRWVHCILWALVALRLLCPFAPESVLSLIPSAETLPRESLYAAQPQLHTGVAALNSAVNPAFSKSFAPQSLTSINPLQVWTWLAGWIWVLGMLLLAVYAGISFRRLQQAVAPSIEEDGLHLCDGIDTPFILGVFRPKIFVPSNLDGAQLAYVAAHERAHLARRDHWWKPLGFLLLTVYWFHPLIWVGYVLLCRDIELACDERVVKTLDPAQKKAYSQTLLDCAVTRRSIAACPVAFGEVGIKTRVKAVLHYKKPAFWVLLTAILVCIAVAVCFLTNPKSAPQAEPFGRSYSVNGVLYENGSFSSTYELFAADQYQLSADGALLADGILQGQSEEIDLTREQFDDLFRSPLTWADNVTPSRLRRDNSRAWKVQTTDTRFYYLLQQRDGTLLLTYGYDNWEFDPMIRFVFRLGRSATELAVGNAYVSSQCIYQTPFSSVLASSNSGYYYYIEENAFVMGHRKTMTEARIEPVTWLWQPFPFTEDAWRGKFFAELGCPDLSGYRTQLYQPLNETYFLLSLDDQLWLVEDHGEQAGIWAIYALQQAESRSSAQWTYMDGVDSAFPPLLLDFDLNFREIQLSCDAGQLYGAYENIHDEVLHYYGDGILYWTAMPNGKQGDDIPDTVQIDFTLLQEDDTALTGTLQLKRDKSGSGIAFQTADCTICDGWQIQWTTAPGITTIRGTLPPDPLAAYLLALTGTESWATSGWQQDNLDLQQLTDLLRNAAQNQVPAPEQMTIWQFDVLLPEGELLRLSAGLEEDLVQIASSDGLPGDTIWVRDAALYQLVRTCNDREPLGIDQAAYDAYRQPVDAHLAYIPDLPGGMRKEQVTKELTGFRLAQESTRLNAQAYKMEVVWNVDPPEQAYILPAGSAWLNSSLQCCGMNVSETYLIVVDGEPVGFVGYWFLMGDQTLERFETQSDLIRSVQQDG